MADIKITEAMEKEIQKQMKLLNLTREEALELVMEDLEVDKMTKASDINADLTPEQKKAVKQAKNTTGAKKADKAKPKVVRERKPDYEKRKIVAEIAESCKNVGTSVEITNIEREITFKIGGNAYTVTLTKHRPPKK